MTKEELREYRKLDGELDVKLSELERWQSRAEKMTPSYSNDGTSSGGINTESIIPLAVEKMEEIQDSLKVEILILATKRIKVKYAISQIKQSEYRQVLELYYIQHKSWQEVADFMGYEIRQITRFHGWGLNEISHVL